MSASVFWGRTQKRPSLGPVLCGRGRAVCQGFVRETLRWGRERGLFWARVDGCLLWGRSRCPWTLSSLPALLSSGRVRSLQGRLCAIFNRLFNGIPVPHPSRKRALPSATTAKRGVALSCLVRRAQERGDLPSVPPASKGGARSPGKNLLSFSSGAERKFKAGKLKSTEFCRAPCGFWCAPHHRVNRWPRRGELSPATPKLGLAPPGVKIAKQPAGRGGGDFRDPRTMKKPVPYAAFHPCKQKKGAGYFHQRWAPPGLPLRAVDWERAAGEVYYPPKLQTPGASPLAGSAVS